MVSRLRRFFDVRPGEGWRVLLAFLYIAVVVAAFLLAKPIRSSLFLSQYGAEPLVYVYAAAPVALSLFLLIYARVTARFGALRVAAGTLVFFAIDVVLFWYAFRFHPPADAAPGTAVWLLPGVFHVWVSVFGIIAPVQAWSLANSLFDVRQARRLFGLIGAGASLGGIAGGLIARYVVRPVGTVDMLLVLAALIAAAAIIVTLITDRVPRSVSGNPARPARHPFLDSLRQIGASRYLRLLAALVFLVAVATQWTAFQLNVVAVARFGDGNTDAITRFLGTFNVVLGAVSVVVQLLVAGPVLRRWGLALTILLLPVSLGAGSLLIVMLPVFGTVMLTNAADQGLRFSLDKVTYELLYLPLAPAQRAPIKNAIDIVVSRVADAAGAVMLGVATEGFLMLPGAGLGLRGTAAINLGFIAAWCAVAIRLRVEYVRTIADSIHRHRIDSEHIAPEALERTAVRALTARLAAADPVEVRYALGLLESQRIDEALPAVRRLLSDPHPDIRRRALALLSGANDRAIGTTVQEMLRDPDIGVRTEALLYVTRVMGVDPLQQLEELGDFEDFSIRAGMAAFLASPGPSQNLDAARVILAAMVATAGEAGARDRAQAARILALVPRSFVDLLIRLLGDDDPGVALEAIRSASAVTRDELIAPLVGALARPELTDAAAAALATYGGTIVPAIDARLRDEATPLEIRRELPAVLVRIGTAPAQQVLIENLLEADVTLRYRVVASLNKLHDRHRDVHIDTKVVELLLAAEIAGHYRSYQVLGPLRAQLKDDDPVLEALRHSMEQELERIFRLMALLTRGAALHDAYVGVRSSNELVRANALEFLDNTLKPELRQVLVPLLDSHVSIEERIALADRLVGAPLETTEQAVATLLASDDGWLRSCAVYAVGALQLHTLEGAVRKFEGTSDPVLRDGVHAALRRLAGEGEVAPHRPVPADMAIGVGAG